MQPRDRLNRQGDSGRGPSVAGSYQQRYGWRAHNQRAGGEELSAHRLRQAGSLDPAGTRALRRWPQRSKLACAAREWSFAIVCGVDRGCGRGTAVSAQQGYAVGSRGFVVGESSRFPRRLRNSDLDCTLKGLGGSRAFEPVKSGVTVCGKNAMPPAFSGVAVHRGDNWLVLIVGFKPLRATAPRPSYFHQSVKPNVAPDIPGLVPFRAQRTETDFTLAV